VTKNDSIEAAPGKSERLRGLIRRLPPVLIVLGSLLTAFAWIVSSPVGGGPDEQVHIASIMCPTPIGKHCTIVGYSDADPLQPHKPVVELPARLLRAYCFAFSPNKSAACIDLVPADTMARTAAADNGRYPGIYYRIMHVFADPSPAAGERTALLVRSANALIAAIVFVGLALLLPWSMRRQLVYVLVGMSVPMLVYFLTSINPSAWGFIGVVTTWFALTGLFATAGDTETPPWRRRALAGVAVFATILSASARTDCAAFCFVVVLAVGAFHLPQLHPKRWRRLRLVWAAMIAVAIIGVVGTFSGTQTTGLMGLSGGTHVNVINRMLLIFNAQHISDLFQGYWAGALGWFDVPMKPITASTVTAIGFGLIFLGLRRMSWTKSIAAGGVMLVMLTLSLFTLQMGGDKVGSNMQTRYIAPLLLVFVAILLSGRYRAGTRPLSLAQTWTMFLLLVMAHAFALHSFIQRYTMGVDEMTQNLNRVVEWWRPWLPSPMAVWVLGSFGFAGLALLLFVVHKPEPAMVTNGFRREFHQAHHESDQLVESVEEG